MSLDIRGALESVTPNKPSDKCKVALILDEIPADEPGLDDLVAAVADTVAYSGRKIAVVFASLGKPVHRDLVNDHRADPQRCRCAR